MPLYEYHCETCHTNFDRLLPIEFRESARCDCGSICGRVFTTLAMHKEFNIFTKDGPGFQSILMSHDEYRHRAKELSLPEALEKHGAKPKYFGGPNAH